MVVKKRKHIGLYLILNKKILALLDLKKQIHDILIDSVKIRMRTDRKLAFISFWWNRFSATIEAKIFGIKPQTFSLNLPDTRFNENNEIREKYKILKRRT